MCQLLPKASDDDYSYISHTALTDLRESMLFFMVQKKMRRLIVELRGPMMCWEIKRKASGKLIYLV